MPTGVYDHSSRRGISHSLQTREKIRLSLTGRKQSTETKRKKSEALTGHKRSERECQIIGARSAGKQYWLGRKHTEESRRKMSAAARRGEASNLWKGGATASNKLLRESVDFKLWREAVFKRDDYECQMCGQRGGRLHPDHIKRFSDFPELRFDVNNGRTLCVPCHKTTDNYGRRGTGRMAA